MGSFSSHYGHWGLAAIMVVIASWIFYRYAAPKSWKEWRGAGLVQAFIIALYAEMYGFPLTIYLLSGVLHVDIPLTGYTGHLWATLLGYGAVGAMVEMAIGWVFVILGLALLMRDGARYTEQTVKGGLRPTVCTASCATRNTRELSWRCSDRSFTGQPWSPWPCSRSLS